MTDTEGSSLVTLYSDVKATNVRWLWYPFIAIGKITLLQGDPSDGKSTMMMHLIGELSTGGATPDGQAFGRPQRILYQCSEDDASDTIRPRLNAAGADCRNVAFINEEVHGGLTLDDERIREAIRDFSPRLVVIDPIQSYIGSDSDLQVAGRARRLMHRLSLWASTYDCAIVLIGHLNKREGSKGLYRSLGSIDIVAAARSVLQVERKPEDKDVRIVRQIKNSIGPSDGEIEFEIRPSTGFRWLDVRTAPRPEAGQSDPVFDTKTDKAAFLIKRFLSSGDVPAVEMYNKLEAEEISRRTAEETRKIIGVRCYRKMKQWYWSLEAKEMDTDGGRPEAEDKGAV